MSDDADAIIAATRYLRHDGCLQLFSLTVCLPSIISIRDVVAILSMMSR